MKLIKYFIGLILVLILGFYSFLRIDDYTSDNYNYCKRYLTFNKNEINKNDTLICTLHIEPEANQKKTIKMYDNLENFEIYASFIAECYPNNPKSGDCSFSDNLIFEKFVPVIKQENDIRVIEIDKNNSYKKDFKAIIVFNKKTDTISFQFLELNKSFKFTYTDYKKYNRFKLSGFLEPIKASFGYSFEDGVYGQEIKLDFD